MSGNAVVSDADWLQMQLHMAQQVGTVQGSIPLHQDGQVFDPLKACDGERPRLDLFARCVCDSEVAFPGQRAYKGMS